ncbi:MAG: signal peptidase I [Roseburia sp.]|nr:signal peptidase I [Ruminococcus sp.]MCM1155986.1 signal peptidase I [Roseburia sp.]MCM1242780.1 signal peptidase I [Roseburia sp.]
MARKKGLHFYQKEKKINSALVKDIFEMIAGTFIVLFVAMALTYFAGMRTSVVGDSMEPALYNGQEILINRFIYRLSSPKRGDVVVFLPNGNQNTHYYVKRIVGLPGETLQITNGRLYINGEMLEEDDLYDKISDPGIAENEITLGNDEYFVLGDNRNSSEDSRSGNIGAVAKSTIIGKAWFHLKSEEGQMGFIE